MLTTALSLSLLVPAGAPAALLPGEPEPAAAAVAAAEVAAAEVVGELRAALATPAWTDDGSTDAPAGWTDPSRALSDLVDGERLGLDALHVDTLVRAVYSRLDGDVEDELGTDDFLDFELIDADVALSAFGGAWSVRASVDLAGEGPGESGPSLEDAFVRWSDRWWGEVTVGRFKPFVTRTSEADPEHLLFPTRTFVGTLFDRWDEGLEWHGFYDEFDWWLSATNRENPALEENLYVARGEWAFYEGWWAPQEGARGAPDFLRLVLGGVFLYDDEDDGESESFGLDLQWQLGPYSMTAEWLNLESEQRLTPSEEADYPFATDGNPWSVTVGSMCLDDELQLGFRLQDAADTFSTKGYGLAVNWFPLDAPFALLGETTYLDRDGEDGTLLRLGLSFGTTRHDEPPLPR